MIETGKDRPVLGIIVFAVLLAVFFLVILIQLFVIGRFFFYSAALGIVPFVAAWRVAFPSGPGERPMIIDRNATRPREPLPFGKRLS